VSRHSRVIDPRLRVADGGLSRPVGDRSSLLWLVDDAAAEPAVAGAKAAALAAATRLGLPVLPGLVLTVEGARRGAQLHRAMRASWSTLTDDGRVALAVRSSSTVEDGARSSMAGVFTSVLDVEGWPALLDAVDVVLDSAGQHPMAVLMQPMLDPVLGGVLFGVDPITGRRDRLLVESIPAGPAELVAGLRSGTRHVLSVRGRLLESDEGRRHRSLTWRRRHRLASLARSTGQAFGGPQDIEWAFDGSGRLWLLQSRPVTAAPAPMPISGPVFGPGPVAETLPEALSPLEEDLWVEPMRAAIEDALKVVGATRARALAESPILITVDGRVAADLDVMGVHERSRPLLAKLDPRPPARRLGAAWRVGRLRGALGPLATDLVIRIDGDLSEVPALAALNDDQLMVVLRGCQRSLHSVQGHEVLCGMVGIGVGVDDGHSATAAALGAVAKARARGLSDAEIVAAEPVVLALSAPAVGRSVVLPPATADSIGVVTAADLAPREALRLRARWLHELSARIAAELGQRLHDRDALPSPEMVRWLRLDELEAAVAGAARPGDLAGRTAKPPGPPLPTEFRLAADGTAVAVVRRKGRRLEGRGAGGGRAMGRVYDPAEGPPSPGMVIVVQSLEPALAGLLPGAAALVAETGSVLSHLAILARELNVATVVGVPDAVKRFPPGSTVVVDGTSGEVSRVGEEVAS